MQIAQCELKQANEFIAQHHRHHKPVQGHRFSLRVVDDSGATLGVAVVGRPVAKSYNPTQVVEVTRLCSDGSKNVCSMLYSSAARISKELGYIYISKRTFLIPNQELV